MASHEVMDWHPPAGDWLVSDPPDGMPEASAAGGVNQTLSDPGSAARVQENLLRRQRERSLSRFFRPRESVNPVVSLLWRFAACATSISVDVALLSGKTASVKASLDEDVATLKRRAQTALGVGNGRLLNSSGTILDVGLPIENARVQNGDSLTLHINSVQACRTKSALAAILGDASVVTWGNSLAGGCSLGVRNQLKNVQQIQASSEAFAAILDDGSVVTWGDAADGGDSSAVQGQLNNVQQIQATYSAFAAILRDGSVVTWGDGRQGGDSSAVQNQLKNVQQIQANDSAFAAILEDGTVLTWGDADHGGDSSAVQVQLRNVQQIQASGNAFAAILRDGSVVTWGNAQNGGDSNAVQDQLRNVQQVQASRSAFAAILGDGSVLTWGAATCGGDSSAVQCQLKHAQQIQANDRAFAAILADGSVAAWGDDFYGGDCSTVEEQLKNVQQIQATYRAFAAILDDASVVTWGSRKCGGDSAAVQDQLKNVQRIQANASAFAAILADGSVVTWGDRDFGADSGVVQDQLKMVQQIQATDRAFAAILEGGSFVNWGMPSSRGLATPPLPTAGTGGPGPSEAQAPVFTRPGPRPLLPRFFPSNSAWRPLASPAKASSSSAPATNPGKDLLASMQARLSHVERLNQHQAAKLAKLSQEVDALRAENSILRQSVLEADPEVSDADDGEGDEDLRTVRRERDQYREQVLAMTKFLHDYGLTWVGDKEEEEETSQLNESLAEKLSRPTSAQVDVQVMCARVEELNALVRQEGAKVVSNRVGGAIHVLRVASCATCWSDADATQADSKQGGQGNYQQYIPAGYKQYIPGSGGSGGGSDFQQYMNFSKYMGGGAGKQGGAADFSKYMGGSGQAGGSDFQKYMDVQQYMGKYTRNDWMKFQQQQNQAQQQVPYSASDCKTPEELEAWKQRQLDVVNSWVPAAYQKNVLDNVDQEYKKNSERLGMAPPSDSASADSTSGVASASGSKASASVSMQQVEADPDVEKALAKARAALAQSSSVESPKALLETDLKQDSKDDQKTKILQPPLATELAAAAPVEVKARFIGRAHLAPLPGAGSGAPGARLARRACPLWARVAASEPLRQPPEL
eukprot:s31_g26.t1